MKERPILFSPPMVRALLCGAKTQTRRVVKPQPGWVGQSGVLSFKGRVGLPHAICPYGQPGDRLWVRETHLQVVPRYGSSDPSVLYRADLDPGQRYLGVDRWTPSIHMPRAASRIALEITGVRVERLNDISESDSIAEGTPAGFWEYDHGEGTETAKESYECLWESINGPGSWKANPWVWVVEFKAVKGGEA